MRLLLFSGGNMGTFAAAAKALLKKIAVDLALDKNIRSKVLIIAGSISLGLLLMMLAPIAVLFSLGEIEPPEVDYTFDKAEYMSQLDPQQREQIENTEADGNAIAEAMKSLGLQEQTIKAQLIYMSFFDDGRLIDFTEYAGYFVNDSEQLIPALNEKYGIAIDYDEFMRTYTMVMNATINEYMFTDTSSKNASDLAAWCRNAYVSQWGYAENSIGERTGEDRIRCADNVGLIMGYIRYNNEIKTFTDDKVNLVYTIRGDIDSIPDIEGIGVYNGKEFGVYIGGGEVIFSSAMGGVQRQALSDGNWTKWCTFKDITYPQIETTTGA